MLSGHGRTNESAGVDHYCVMPAGGASREGWMGRDGTWGGVMNDEGSQKVLDLLRDYNKLNVTVRRLSVRSDTVVALQWMSTLGTVR